MDRDEEKDLYIKAKLKDGYVPEKIDNLFNNSAQIIENKGGVFMEENKNQSVNKNKNQVVLKRVAGIAACAIIVLGGGNIYATTQGYDNVFFMIKEWVAPSKEAYGKDEILSDRDITISYKSIEVAKGIKMQINRLVVKDNETKLYLKIDQSETKLNITPFTYVVRDENGNAICNYTSSNKQIIYTEELQLNGLKKDAKKLELQVIQNDNETLVKFEIDLENKEIQVIGNEQELQKVSEEELKKYLGAFALLNYEDDKLNAGVTDKETLENVRKLMVANQIAQIKELDLDKMNSIMKSFANIELNKDDLTQCANLQAKIDGLCIDVTDIMYSNEIYTVTYTYCYPSSEDIDKNRIEDLPIYEMTIGLTINEDQTYSKYCVSSKMESKLVKAGKEIDNEESVDIIDISAKCRDTIEKYLSISGKSEGAPESVLEELDIMTYQEFELLRQNEFNIRDGYVKTTCNYDKFKKLMLNYMTGELYANRFLGIFKEIDEKLAVRNGGETGITYEIKEVDFEKITNDLCICNVEYKQDPSDGTDQKMKITLKNSNGKYVVSNVEHLKNEDPSISEITSDKNSKKFIGEWHLDYAIGTSEYEQKLSDLHGGNGITIKINEDGTFTEFVQDTELLTGEYVRINENTIKRIYQDGRVVYTSYSINALGEIVISNISSASQTIIEYYSQKDVNIYETKDYFVGDWWRTVKDGNSEEYKYMISIRSDGKFLIVQDNNIQEIGTYTVKDNGSEDVPFITLQFNNGTKKELKLIQGSESYLVTEGTKEQFQYFNSVG